MILQRTNTILYCENWEKTVAFYRHIFHFDVNHQTDWFIEFKLTAASYLSVANADRATIDSVEGQGITLSWQVNDINAAHDKLQAMGVDVTGIKKKWGAHLFYLYDPEGHRIELWQFLTA